MPVSDEGHIPVVMHEVFKLNPRTTKELGIGFGKWGTLLREVLDARHGRCRPEQWQASLEGYEIHPEYRNPAWNLYSRVYAPYNFLRMDWYPPVDLVMMMDSLEHLPPEEGRPFLEAAVEHSGHVIVSVPNGEMPQGEVYGNPFEAHRWTFEGLTEFEKFEGAQVLHRGICTVVSIPGKRK
jgi:hypothetical protein